MTHRFWCEHAAIDGEVRHAVSIDVVDGRFRSIEADTVPAVDAARLSGLSVPGFANAHSHAFHRALRSRTQADRGTFWTWREIMYQAADRLDPDSYQRLARAVFAEMVCAGISCVGEFHYLHHNRDGTPYAEPNAMGEAVLAAAGEAGLRMTLLDTLYRHGDLAHDGHRPPAGPQVRYVDRSPEAWAARVDTLAAGDNHRIGGAIHSVRAVDPAAMGVVAEWCRSNSAPLHAHVSEQVVENEQCLAHHGCTPIALLDRVGVLGPDFTAVHATHITADDMDRLARSGSAVCMCPTTERDLGDGIGPTLALVTAGVAISLGSDSHAEIDHCVEMRAVELDQRLATEQRGLHDASELLGMATVMGHRALGWEDAGTISVGNRADLTTIDLGSVRTAGASADLAIENAVFAATAADVTSVIIDGDLVVDSGEHVHLDVAAELATSIQGLFRVTSLVIDNIGSLVTNDPALGRGPLGLVENASVVITAGLVEAVGPAGALADTRFDAEGACVLPGFVDSHTHLVFAGDRAEEFTARMAGRPYDGGGIRVTTDATRNATTDQLDRLVRRRLVEAHHAGTTTIEIKSGYGLNVADEVRSLEVAERFTTETTFLGAHLLPAEFEGREADYVDLVCGDMLTAAAPHARWIDAFCETGAFDADQCRAVLMAGRAAGLGLRLHGNQLGPGPGVQLAVECGCASVDHCTHLTDADIDALANSQTVATFLPAADFSTRQPYPDARRVIDAGATVAIASNCNPGSSYTTSISFCIAIAVREMHMTIDEAIQAATIGGAAALKREDIGRLTPGSAGHATVLSAPTHHHLAYRPGVPLVRHTIGPLGVFA